MVARLRDSGPLLSRDVPDTCQVPWPSTGWTNNRNVTQMLELLSARGEVAVAGEWRADPEALDQPFVGRAALLSPFDRLVHDRERAQALFDFEYILEMYKPAATRRWGYFALPVLRRDRLVGKLDARADRRAGTFTVHAQHEDAPFSSAVRTDVKHEIEELAAWLGLRLVG